MLDLAAIFIYGIAFKGHLIVVVLGLKGSRKHVLGLWQGAMENTTVCASFLEVMSRRGLNISKDYLFVLNGSKALRPTVSRMFGTNVAVQRCQQHKLTNVLDHLPKEHQHAIYTRISAAPTLKEELEETRIIHKFGIAWLLRKTLSTTNPI